MPSKSKTKGSSWERELAKILSETFGGSWLRVPNSGAFVGKTNSYRKETMSAKQIGAFRGDIIPDDSMPNIVLECKSYGDFGFHQMIQGENKQLDAWILQTLDATDSEEFWMLCMKFNRKGEFVLFDKRFLDKFVVKNYSVYKSNIFTDLQSFLQLNKSVIKDLCK